MRLARTSLIVAVSLMLVASVSAAADGEDEVDPTAPAYFTFTTGFPVDFAEGDVTNIDGITTEIRRGAEVGVPVEATDPRVSGLLTAAYNADAVAFDDSHFTAFSTRQRLVNEGGAWSGTGMSVVAFTREMALAEGIPLSAELNVLTGEGGYEGLTLIMSASHDGDDEAQWGVIIPTDGMPPTPDPVEPSAEEFHSRHGRTSSPPTHLRRRGLQLRRTDATHAWAGTTVLPQRE